MVETNLAEQNELLKGKLARMTLALQSAHKGIKRLKFKLDYANGKLRQDDNDIKAVEDMLLKKTGKDYNTHLGEDLLAIASSFKNQYRTAFGKPVTVFWPDSASLHVKYTGAECWDGKIGGTD